MPATVIVPVERQSVSAVSASSSRSSGSACELPEQRRAEARRVAVERQVVRQAAERRAVADRGRDVDPHLLVDAQAAAAGVPPPAQQRAAGAGEVRDLVEDLGSGQAGAPVVEAPGARQQVDRQQVGGDDILQRHRVARLRGAAHPQAPAHGLAGVEGAAAGEVVLGRVELGERTAEDEATAGVAVDVRGTGRVDGREVGAVLDRVAERDGAAGVVGVDDLAGDQGSGRGRHAGLRLAVLPADAGDVFTGAEAGRRGRQRRVRRRVRRATPEGEDAGRGVFLVAHPHAHAGREVGQARVGAGGDARHLHLDGQGVDHHHVVERHVAVVARYEVVAESLVQGWRVRGCRPSCFWRSRRSRSVRTWSPDG